MQEVVERRIIHHLDYDEWCKQNKLPKDSTSRIVYKQWVQAIPKLQDIIDNIVVGYLDKAYEQLGKHVEKDEVY